MRVNPRVCFFSALMIVGAFTIGAVEAHAQGSGSSGSLGGYGGSMSISSAGMGGTNIPYAGGYSGFMPFRMGGGGSLSFQSRGNSAMGSNRTSFSLMAISGGMSTMPAGRIRSLGFGSEVFSSPGSMGMGTSKGTGVMPPSFGYPFRQPPSLLGSSSGAPGMSM